MDNASKNATDMISRLQMQYNRGRQAAITNELVDIITGKRSQSLLPLAFTDQLNRCQCVVIASDSVGVCHRITSMSAKQYM